MRSWRKGMPHSAVLIPVPEAEEAVGRWRRLFDPMASAGVPAHITLIVPWRDPEAITAGDLDRLGVVAGATLPFDFELSEVGWFGPGVLWLGPRDPDPFVKLIGALVDEFDLPPWGGEFGQVIPHLTVAHTIEGHQLGTVAERLSDDVPICGRAAQLSVMVGHGRHWWEQANLRF